MLAPYLLDVVNAAPEVKHEALPFLRIMLTCSVGLLVFFMLGGAFRAAGDAQTPLRLGLAVTVLNAGLNVVLIRGLGPIPGARARRARPSARSRRTPSSAAPACCTSSPAAR